MEKEISMQIEESWANGSIEGLVRAAVAAAKQGHHDLYQKAYDRITILQAVGFRPRRSNVRTAEFN
jgi:FixJ family two-component response regulator